MKVWRTLKQNSEFLSGNAALVMTTCPVSSKTPGVFAFSKLCCMGVRTAAGGNEYPPQVLRKLTRLQ